MEEFVDVADGRKAGVRLKALNLLVPLRRFKQAPSSILIAFVCRVLGLPLL
jgi:hypothetical protein